MNVYQKSDDVDIVALIADRIGSPNRRNVLLAERILNALRARGYDIVSSEPEKRYAPPF